MTIDTLFATMGGYAEPITPLAEKVGLAELRQFVAGLPGAVELEPHDTQLWRIRVDDAFVLAYPDLTAVYSPDDAAPVAALTAKLTRATKHLPGLAPSA